MNPIDAQFQALRAAGRTALMPFLPAGDPDLDFTSLALASLAQAGADLIEVGFPFSDPIADGPVIQASYTRALARHVKLAEIFDHLGGRTRLADWRTPLVAMASYSLIYRLGPARFVESAQQAGLAGVIVPDLPVEEAADLRAIARERDFKLVLLVTPTTTPERAERIVQACSGFVYVVSVVGITGERDRLPAELSGMLTRLRSLTDLPLCVGFGVSTPEQVRSLRGQAEGVIVGSAVVKRLDAAQQDRTRALQEIAAFVSELAQALKS